MKFFLKKIWHSCLDGADFVVKQRFDFRYDEITKELCAVPLDELAK